MIGLCINVSLFQLHESQFKKLYTDLFSFFLQEKFENNSGVLGGVRACLPSFGDVRGAFILDFG